MLHGAPRAMGSHRSAPTTRWRSLTVLVSLLAACDRNGGDLVLVGTVERTLIEMVAPVSETLVRLPVGRGQHVHAGDVLAQLDPSVAEAEVAAAEARLAGARTA
jgi:multidrug efflux pump subunit AcrA (membrane-fusion protein)